MNTRHLLGIAACAVLSAAWARGDLIQNGGFESGTFDGWVYTGNPASSPMHGVLARDPLNAGLQAPLDGEWDPVEGTLFAALWSTDSQGSGGATLSTQFAALAGQTVEFDYFFDYGDFNPFFDWARGQLSWAGDSMELFAHNTSVANELPDDTNIDWRHISAIIPADGTYTLTFTINDAEGFFESILGVDDVFVIPSPGGALILGAAALFARRRRG